MGAKIDVNINHDTEGVRNPDTEGVQSLTVRYGTGGSHFSIFKLQVLKCSFLFPSFYFFYYFNGVQGTVFLMM